MPSRPLVPTHRRCLRLLALLLVSLLCQLSHAFRLPFPRRQPLPSHRPVTHQQQHALAALNGAAAVTGAAATESSERQPKPAAAAAAEDDGTDYYALRFAGVAKLHGAEGLARLRQAHVCVVGLGGVGSWVVEALARSGVGRLTLIDLDAICISNTNRQMHALTHTIGQSKAQVMRQRVLDINPDCQVEVRLEFLTGATAEELLLAPLWGDASGNGGGGDGSGDGGGGDGGGAGTPEGLYDCVVDAIDSLEDKCVLLAACRQARMPVVCVGAAGGRADPTKVAVSDLTRADYDGLLFAVRKKLRQEYGFPRGTRRNVRGRKWGVAAVFSTELPPPSQAQGGLACELGDDARLGLGGCDGSFGTASYVTGLFGLMAAGIATSMLAAAPVTETTPAVAEHEAVDDSISSSASGGGGSEWRWSRHALRDLGRQRAPRRAAPADGGDDVWSEVLLGRGEPPEA